LYTEKYKILLREMKEDTNRLKSSRSNFQQGCPVLQMVSHFILTWPSLWVHAGEQYKTETHLSQVSFYKDILFDLITSLEAHLQIHLPYGLFQHMPSGETQTFSLQQGTYPKDLKAGIQTGTCTPTFIALFTIVKRWS
jgi:hypothetical protein